jgi:hypothetical protein
MTVHEIRALLAADKPTVGTWLQLPSPAVAELMARAGYDWVAVDMEHGSFGRTGLPDIFRAIECGGAAPFARLGEASKTQIKAALEAGAQGLIFPMIKSRAQLDRAIDLSVYPGLDNWRAAGETAPEYRGVGFCRANAFGKDFDAYREQRAPELFLVAQIEHIRAVSSWKPLFPTRVWTPSWWGPMIYPAPWARRGALAIPTSRLLWPALPLSAPAAGRAWACTSCSPIRRNWPGRRRRAAGLSPTALIPSFCGALRNAPGRRAGSEHYRLRRVGLSRLA